MERLNETALACGVVAGSVLLWIGVPIGVFWLAGRLTTDSVEGLLFALVAIPAAMALGAWGLFRLNGLYEAQRGGPRPAPGPPAWRRSLGEERHGARGSARPRRLIDVAMTASAITAVVAFAVWFMFFAELRLGPLP